MDIISKIEAILFVASRPLTYKKFAQALAVDEAEVKSCLKELQQKYSGESGIQIIESGNEVQMVTNPTNSEIVGKFTKIEALGELTKAQVETLTVIAYRAPITRPELEEIRGVNCAIILRNLLMRGLIIERQPADDLLPLYELSIESLRGLGISHKEELPDYESLHSHTHFERDSRTLEE